MSFQYCAGLEEEFVFVGRLDNLGMSYLSLQALIDSSSRQGALAEETAVRAVALFDHEEVGSASAQGKHCIHLLLLISLPPWQMRCALMLMAMPDHAAPPSS